MKSMVRMTVTIFWDVTPCHLLAASSWLGLLYEPENGGITFLRNVYKSVP